MTEGLFVCPQCYTKEGKEGKGLLLKGKIQHSFTKGILCQMNLKILSDKIIDFLDKSSAVDLICLDFYKVFDTVKRLVKLEETRISEIV